MEKYKGEIYGVKISKDNDNIEINNKVD